MIWSAPKPAFCRFLRTALLSFNPVLFNYQSYAGDPAVLTILATRADMAAQINKVYQQADDVGRLVAEGKTGRPTEYERTHVEPPEWWDVFWQRHLADSIAIPRLSAIIDG